MTSSESMDQVLLSKHFGIIGTGHLGRAFAALLLERGVPRENLSVADKLLSASDSSSPASAAIDRLGLADRITSNERILGECDIAFVMIPPQVLQDMRGLKTGERTKVISSLAGVPLEVIRDYFGERSVRIMPGPPDSIASGNGMVAVLPADRFVEGLLTSLGLRAFGLSTEEEMHRHTVGMTMPVLLMMAEEMSLPLDDLLETLRGECPYFEDVYGWGRSGVDGLSDRAAREAYVRRMVTEGGITDAVVKTIRSGAPMVEAWRAGIQRSREIAAAAVAAG